MLDSLTSWLILIAVIALLFGGASKIPEFARAMGRAVGEFKKAQTEVEKEIKKMQDETKQ
jgi:sec-independent protein translocase protein TatA